MRNIIRKEFKLSASVLSFIFIAFGLMFFLPGYPVLCGAFFITLGIFQSFQNSVTANDITFSALLPIAKIDVVKGKYAFSCFIEMAGFAVMLTAVLIRMTVFTDSAVYLSNALMNANFYALGCALIVFGIFNSIFIGGFFKTAYRLKPFIGYCFSAFFIITIAEIMHHIPGLEVLNSFGFNNISLQLTLLAAGIVIYIIMTLLSCKKACSDFEKIDL